VRGAKYILSEHLETPKNLITQSYRILGVSILIKVLFFQTLYQFFNIPHEFQACVSPHPRIDELRAGTAFL